LGIVSDSSTVKKTNAVAMVAVVMVFFNPIAGLILGHIALTQIKRTGENGRTAALVAAVVGWVLASLLVLGLLSALAAGSLMSLVDAGVLG
jgi:hypothetical protein